MQADGQRSGQQYTKDGRHRRRGNAIRYRSETLRKAMMMLPGCRHQALDRIGKTLVSEDPGLGLRFAVFARLTRHEAIPDTEQVPRRLRRLLRRAIILPLVVISLLALLAASGLTFSRQTCPVGRHAAAAGMSSESLATRCQAGPAIKLDQVRMR